MSNGFLKKVAIGAFVGIPLASTVVIAALAFRTAAGDEEYRYSPSEQPQISAPTLTKP